MKTPIFKEVDHIYYEDCGLFVAVFVDGTKRMMTQDEINDAIEFSSHVRARYTRTSLGELSYALPTHFHLTATT